MSEAEKIAAALRDLRRGTDALNGSQRDFNRLLAELNAGELRAMATWLRAHVALLRSGHGPSNGQRL